VLKMASKEEEGACEAALVQCGLLRGDSGALPSHEVFKVDVAGLEGMPWRNLVPPVVCRVFASPQSPVR